MKALLNELLPRFELEVEPNVLSFQGKADLERNIAPTMRAWHDVPGIEPRFIVMRDNDGSDCAVLKQRLIGHCQGHGHPYLVRIVIQELESWFLGDMAAVASAYGKPSLAKFAAKQPYRESDRIANASQMLAKITAANGKVTRAGDIAPHMDLERNTSVSFRVFCEGVRKMAEAA